MSFEHHDEHYLAFVMGELCQDSTIFEKQDNLPVWWIERTATFMTSMPDHQLYSWTIQQLARPDVL
jgi:hypothetical protein